MQQADTAGSTRSKNPSPGNFGNFSTLRLRLSLDLGGPLLTKDITKSPPAQMCAVDSRIECLKDFVGLAITADDLDVMTKNVLGHIWHSLDDMRVLTSGMVKAEAAA
ncbi:hypothetical protein [Sphingomonas hankookensis]|uniref:hypothetical protein n=1 Tax=Sphingomonas hankookensis TaxID=563996 RepID=UPI003D302DAA